MIYIIFREPCLRKVCRGVLELRKSSYFCNKPTPIKQMLLVSYLNGRCLKKYSSFIERADTRPATTNGNSSI